MGDMADYVNELMWDDLVEEPEDSNWLQLTRTYRYKVLAIITETDKAWLLRMKQPRWSTNIDKIWFPKSCCSINLKTGKISVPAWLVQKKKHRSTGWI